MADMKFASWPGTLAAATWLLTPACGPAAQPPRALLLSQVRPAQAQGVFLNEKLVLHFSEEIDPTSVHHGSVWVVSDDGRPARGTWQVQSKVLTFWPEPPKAPDLSDGGYVPGMGYSLHLVGFPRPDGLHSRTGAFLERGVRWRFQTAGYQGLGRGLLLEDSSLGVARPLVLVSPEIEPAGEVLLEGEEPLDPSTLGDDEFVLSPLASAASRPVALRARLLENYDKYEVPRRGTTLLALTPSQRLEPGVAYSLERIQGRARLLDFGGNPVRTIVGQVAGRPPVVRVREAPVESSGFWSEEFENPELRSVEAVAGTQGSALWADSGQVEVRWPSAAGDGSSGDVQLQALESRTDVAATSLKLAEGMVCRLSTARGLVSLRSQGSIELDGRLERVGGALVDPRRLTSADLTRRALGLEERSAVALSSWLQSAREQQIDVTVLIAGGDLVLSGDLEVHTQLVLIAGGHVRLRNGALPRAPRVWVFSNFSRLSSQSGPLPDYRPIGSSATNVSADLGERDNPALVLDSPAPGDPNPLRAPITYAVLSGPIPRSGAARRWYPCLVESSSGTGRAQVRFFAENDQPGDENKLVDDPQLLGGAKSLRMRIDLALLPGVVWGPPSVERVQLRWDPEGAR